MNIMNDSGLPLSNISQSYAPTASSVTRTTSRLPSSARQSLINISLGMGIMLAALSGGVYLMMTNKEVLLGGKASVDKQSSFSFASPAQVTPGEQFTVDVMLDTSADPEYTISGADAVVQYTFIPEQQDGWGGMGREVMDGSRLGLGAGGPNGGGGGGISWEEQKSLGAFRYGVYPDLTLVKTEYGSIFDSYPLPSSIMCGGIAGVQCPSGYVCQIDASMRGVPDASGTCVQDVMDKVQQGAEKVLGATTRSKKLAQVTESFPSNVLVDPNPEYQKPVPMPVPMPPTTGAIQGMVSISGVKNYAVDDQGYFKGFTGKGMFARLTFIAHTAGKLELKFAYKGETATDDSNIMGFLKTVPVSVQKTSERLLTNPQSMQIVVAKATSSATPTPIPTTPPPLPTPPPTATPRPENPVSWRTGAVSLEADDFSILINRNGKMQSFFGRTGNMTIHSDMNTAKPTLELSWTENDVPMHFYMYLSNTLSSWSVAEMRTDDGSKNGEWVYFRNLDIKSLLGDVFISPKFEIKSSDRGSLVDGDTVVSYITFKNLRLQSLLKPQPTPTPTPLSNTPVLNVSLSLEGRSMHGTRALVYKVVPEGERLLGGVKINEYGNGSLSLLAGNTELSDKALRLFVEVPGYLRAYSQFIYPTKSDTLMMNAKFGMLSAGDVHIGAGGFGDHQVNSVDVAELYTQWSSATGSTRNEGELTGDLNGDSVVNNRDYAILMLNFGKKTNL